MTDRTKEIMDRLNQIEGYCFSSMKYLLRAIMIVLGRNKSGYKFTIENRYTNAEYKYPNAIDYIPICINGNLFVDVLLDEIDGKLVTDKFVLIRELDKDMIFINKK